MLSLRATLCSPSLVLHSFLGQPQSEVRNIQIAIKGKRQPTNEDHAESAPEDHVEKTLQQIPETITREEFNAFTANLTNTLHAQQRMMEDLMQHLAQQGPSPAPAADVPPTVQRGLGGSYTAGKYRSSMNRLEHRPRERPLNSKQSSFGSQCNRHGVQGHQAANQR